MRLPIIVKNLIISFCLLIVSGTAVLAQKIIKVDSSHVMTLRVDPSNAVGGVASDFFSEVNYIPLETTKESLFGSISKLEITDDYYIILDQNTHCILFFTKTGKFHTKIKSSEGSPIYDFSVNKWTKQIIYTRDNYKNLAYCDYDGKIIKTTKLGGETAKDEVTQYSFYFIAPDKIVGQNYQNTLDSTDKYYKTFSKSLIVYAMDNHKVYAQGLPFKKSTGKVEYAWTGLGPLTSFGVDTAYFYSKMWDYSIYTITPNAIQFTYKFHLPMFSSLPNDFMTNALYADKKYEWLQKNRDVIYGLGNFFRTGNNLVFKTFSENGYNNKEDNLIYNLKSGTLIAYKHIQQDERSYFLPIYDPTGYTFNSSGILACANGYIYTSVSAVGLYKGYNDNTEQKVNYPPALAEYFKKGSIKDNPAILQLKLKDDL
ncbi:6-bladed beta-propeller [Mucilaginibacter sp. UYCu711]|uniref:6-bladed beta-propeller n=1 Tax=Mucilaginibacter sp. UYCu711 TaxID=3156339 RepID=UPI003D19387A